MLKHLRKINKINQEELAERCNMSQGFLSKIETKHFNITVRQIITLARELRTNVVHVAAWFIMKELEQQAMTMEFPVENDEEDENAVEEAIKEDDKE